MRTKTNINNARLSFAAFPNLASVVLTTKLNRWSNDKYVEVDKEFEKMAKEARSLGYKLRMDN